MSRKHKPLRTVPARTAAPTAPGPEYLRRALLGLATALIAARGLLPGEDPGLLDPESNPLAFTVPLLWLLGLAGWCVWRFWAAEDDWYAGPVDAGLAVVAALMLLTTGLVAAYKRPAWLVASEWVGLLVAFFLVRQLARSPADRRGLLAAVLATGVSLAAQSLYQHAWPKPLSPLSGLDPADWPRLRCEVLGATAAAPECSFPASLAWGPVFLAVQDDGPAPFQRFAAKHNVYLETEEPALPALLRPALPNTAATFTSPSHLAGLLALVLPVLAGCALAVWLGGAPRWQRAVAAGFALIVAAALALSQVRSALLPCLLVGAGAAILAWRHIRLGPGTAVRPALPRGLLLVGLAGPAVLLVLAFVLGPAEAGGFRVVTDHWASAASLLREHFWLGVGPGNFSRHFPLFLRPGAEEAREPWSFVLEVWSSGGVVAVAVLAAALALFFRRTLSFGLRPGGDVPQDSDVGTRWEFYEGGMAGLIVAFVLRALPLPAAEIPGEALVAAARALVWFAVFALIHGNRWSGTTSVLACTAGVAALLLHLLVNDGISVPGVTQPLWVLAALALNGVPESPVLWGRGWLGRVLPLPVAAAAFLLFYVEIFAPVSDAAGTNRSALSLAQLYLDLRAGVGQATESGQVETVRAPGQVLGRIVQALEQAVRSEPGNARLWSNLANWYGELYQGFPEKADYLLRASRYARKAQALDPLGRDGYLAEARLCLIAARFSPSDEVRKQAGAEVPTVLSKVAGNAPQNPRLQFRLAEAHFQFGDPALGRVHAERALALDEQTPSSLLRLTDRQREQARKRLASAPTGQP